MNEQIANQEQRPTETTSWHAHFDRLEPGTKGLLLGILAAVAYTAANLALRELSLNIHGDFDWEIWVSCIKAVPAATLAWVLIGWRAMRGLPALPPRDQVVTLLGTGLMMQFAGNVLFQHALGLGGLALTVPAMFCMLILGSAVLGRVMIGDAISKRSIVSMVLLLCSIVILRAGSAKATEFVTGHGSALLGLYAMLAAGTAGFSYAVCNVVIRKSVRSEVSLSATLVLLSTSGVVGLGIVCLVRMGPEEMLATSRADFGTMLLAGLFNAIAFFSLGAALKHLSVLHLNLLNGSQIAMASTAGVLFFDEHLTTPLLLGTGMTIVGLMCLDRPGKGSSSDDTKDEQEPVPQTIASQTNGDST